MVSLRAVVIGLNSPCALWILVCVCALTSRPCFAMEDEETHRTTSSAGGVGSVCQALDPSPSVEPFVDELTTPSVIDISTTQQVTIGAYRIKQKLHRDLPETTLYAYGTSPETASCPGPTLVATRGIESRIRWENHINDAEHFLTVDRSIHWATVRKWMLL